VKVKPNPRYDAFSAELKKTKRLFTKWQGVAFRASPLEFARVVNLLDGRGSLNFGGRWSAAGTFRAVNLSLSQETAMAESAAKFTYYNLRETDLTPKLVVGIRVSLRKVVDLTNPQGLKKQEWFHPDELLEEDWRKVNEAGFESQSQAFGRAAHDLGAEAIVAPSARINGGVNLVYFPNSVLRARNVEILGEEDLKRWLKKR
jgi:RES domain-containing protein